MAQAAGRGDPYGWRQESRNLLRAVAGGSLFGMPLLYTMEMWRQAISCAASHLLVFRMLGATDPYLLIEVRPHPEESRREGSLYILPVEARVLFYSLD